MRWSDWLISCLCSVVLCPHLAHAASTEPNSTGLLCTDGKILCVSRGLQNSRIFSPMRIRAEITSPNNIQVAWELKDSTGQSLLSGSTFDYLEPFAAQSAGSKALDVTVYILEPAKSDHGMLVLTPQRYDLSSGTTDLGCLSIPVRLDTSTTILTILLPKDLRMYEEEVIAHVEQPKKADFKPETPLVQKAVAVMKVEEGAKMAATAEAVLRAVPAQGEPWHVKSLRLDHGTAHLDIDSDAWAGVSYYWFGVGYLLEKSLKQFPGVREVEFK